MDYIPIHFMHKSVNFDELIALYAASDVCVVSSTRDGMNLVSFEYIATQQDRKGVLILSEFAGAAQSLNGSIVVNPWNAEELSRAYHEAVSLDQELRDRNFQKLYKYISNYTRFVAVRRLYARPLLRLTAHSGDSRSLLNYRIADCDRGD